MCVNNRLINAQLITALISHLFIAMNAIQMNCWEGLNIKIFVCPITGVTKFFKILFSKKYRTDFNITAQYEG